MKKIAVILLALLFIPREAFAAVPLIDYLREHYYGTVQDGKFVYKWCGYDFDLADWTYDLYANSAEAQSQNSIDLTNLTTLLTAKSRDNTQVVSISVCDFSDIYSNASLNISDLKQIAANSESTLVESFQNKGVRVISREIKEREFLGREAALLQIIIEQGARLYVSRILMMTGGTLHMFDIYCPTVKDFERILARFSLQ